MTTLRTDMGIEPKQIEPLSHSLRQVGCTLHRQSPAWGSEGPPRMRSPHALPRSASRPSHDKYRAVSVEKRVPWRSGFLSVLDPRDCERVRTKCPGGNPTNHQFKWGMRLPDAKSSSIKWLRCSRSVWIMGMGQQGKIEVLCVCEILACFWLLSLDVSSLPRTNRQSILWISFGKGVFSERSIF